MSEFNRKIKQINNIPELIPEMVPVENLLGTKIPIQISALTNRKKLYTPHFEVNPRRLYSVLNMGPDDLLKANEADPLACWVVDKYNKQQVLNRFVVIARGNHRGATHLYTSTINVDVTGVAQMGSDGKLLKMEGVFIPDLRLYPFSIFMARVRAYLSQY